MRTHVALCALVAAVRSASVDLNKRASPLAVTLTHLNDTAIKVDITNSGQTGYNLLYAGSLLDDAPTDDLIITSATSPATFHGVHLRPLQSHLTQDAFVPIAAGQTISKQIDIAEIYETPSDTYFVTAAGSFPYAEANSTDLSGKSLPFTSNKITIDIDGDVAQNVIYKVDRMHSKRTDLESDCSSTQLSAVTAALSNCEKLANAAANAAANGHNTIFAEYFKTESARPDVATRLRDVAKDCAATTGGATTTSCKDQYSACSDNVLAYTIPQKNAVFLCSSFFSYLPAVADSCHAQDQATTIIHENTHAPAVDNPGTSDNGYGYSAATALSSSQALANADSYALYSNAIYLDCHGSGSKPGSLSLAQPGDAIKGVAADSSGDQGGSEQGGTTSETPSSSSGVNAGDSTSWHWGGWTWGTGTRRFAGTPH